MTEPGDRARARAEMPSGTGRILDSRSLPSSHRRLAELLRTGINVLDVGCGTGAITRDIAGAVWPGRVVGVDVSEPLLAQGAAADNGRAKARFVRADLHALPFAQAFDIVTAARVLQWVARPDIAVRELAHATKPGGLVLALDFDHERIQWNPAPPSSMLRFYEAFLQWRAEAGMDNAIASRLYALFQAAGLTDVRVTPQHEQTSRADPDFARRAGIWADVAASRGHQMVRDGVIDEPQRADAERDYRAWVESAAESQTLHLLAAEARVPALS